MAAPAVYNERKKTEAPNLYRIVKKQVLNPTVTLMEVEAPAISAKAKAGQFIILRVDSEGERIPLTVANTDPARGTITIIFQIVGATTRLLNTLEAGDSIRDFVGPLGVPTALGGVSSAAVIGGGVGSAIAYPIAKQLHSNGAHVDSIIGFRSKELVILKDEFAAVSDRLVLMTDGSAGEKGLVTAALERLITEGAQYDAVFAIGPLIMMKFVALTTKKYGIKTVVSMNPIMIDGTGMCGCCRLTVGGVTKFACVDGPDFDGHLVDFDEAIARSSAYRPFEERAREKGCRLLKKEVE